jgi:hypothetical protein
MFFPMPSEPEDDAKAGASLVWFAKPWMYHLPETPEIRGSGK